MLQDFVLQLIKRLMSENPTFFKVIQVIAAIVALITFLPQILNEAGFAIPTLINKAAGIAALVSIFIAQLPIKNVEANK